MWAYLSQLNRRRLFRRRERIAHKNARERIAILTSQDRAEILSILAKFTPTQTGHDLIRAGSEHDGGYLLPDDLAGIKALYSPGVSETLGFDLEMANRGIPCFLADGTVDEPADMHEAMTFEKMMIGDGPAGTFMSLESWVTRTAPPKGDLMLQMDIEGAEYNVLLDTPSSLLNLFRIIVLELHSIDDFLLGERRSLRRFMEHLLENHMICHVHPNNALPPVNILGRMVPPLIELTLLRKDRLASGAHGEALYPHPLDERNVVNNPVKNTPPFWREA